MEESQNFGHEHPLMLLDEEAECWRCEKKVSAPSFGCLESCGFYLHKGCAEAPLEINHPFHPDHPFILFQNPPYGRHTCDFCNRECKKFIYRCSSCDLDLHLKCALFTLNIAEKKLKELEHVAVKDPFDSPGKNVRKCFGCEEPLSSYAYYSPDCGFNMHKKCVELPFKMNHAFHRKHALSLQFITDKKLACKICQKTQKRGIIYCCSLCKFVVHIECVSPLRISKEFCLQHTYSMCWRQSSFICDACGIEGHHAAQICTVCDIIVHPKCISLPRIIKSIWHEKHSVFHKYFIQKENLITKDCMICYDGVDTEHGSYYCPDCDVIFHVNCVTKDKDLYKIVSPENEDDSDGKLLLKAAAMISELMIQVASKQCSWKQ